MANLISDLESLKAEIGNDIFRSFLIPNTYLDSPMMSIPYVLEIDKTKYLLVRHIEKGNVEALRRSNLVPKYYNPYFLMQSKYAGVAKDVYSLILSLMGDNPEIHIDSDVPIAFYNNLMKFLPKKRLITRKGFKEEKTVFIYSITKGTVSSNFQALRNAVSGIAKELISNNLYRELLGKVLKVADTRFEYLDSLMRDCLITHMIINSVVNLHQLTGIPIGSRNNSSNIVAIYSVDEDQVLVVSEDELHYEQLNEVSQHRNFHSAMCSILKNARGIGYEDNNTSVSAYLKLRELNIQMNECSKLLRQWREFRAAEDSAFYVVAGLATKYAMEKTIDAVKNKINVGTSMTEIDVKNMFFDYLETFKEENGLRYNFKEFFGSFYATDRELLPSLATGYAIDKKTPAVKIDAGILLCEENGLILAGTDIARTFVIDQDMEAAYECIRETVIRDIIPALSTRKTFEAVFLEGINALSRRCETILKNCSLCTKDFNMKEEYNRDIGHLMSQQESSEYKIERGCREFLRKNTVGCVEIQWQFGKYALAYEDMWILTDNDVFNITR